MQNRLIHGFTGKLCRPALLFIFTVGLATSGCSKLVIDPVSTNEVESLRSAGNTQNGYIVYEPRVLFPITYSVDEDGKESCTAGDPIYVPNFERPYRVDPRAGFGNSDLTLEIANGVFLSKAIDKSDNTAVLDFLAARGFPAAEAAARTGTQELQRSCRPGVYEYVQVNGVITLKLVSAQ